MKTEAMDFLIYSYFGIVPKKVFDEKKAVCMKDDEYRDYCMRMAIMKAYDDATGQGAYNTLFNAKEYENFEVNKLKDRSKKAKNIAARAIFDSLKDKIEPGNYDDWHKNICEKLVAAYENICDKQQKPFFTYGNAQKWVNMTMKYLWLLGILPDGISENDLHIPVDRYIIDALHENSFNIPEAAWSKWDSNDYYKAFRKNDFSQSNTTLEWENIAWIKQAELKKKSNKEKKCSEFFKEDTTVQLNK